MNNKPENDLEETIRDESLLQFVNEGPNNVMSWVTAALMTKENSMKTYYLEKMVKCIRREKGVFDYLKGIYYTHKIGRKDLNRELADEMIREHPIAGRFFKYASYLPPTSII